ncbi:MAG: hypothetical protein H6Q70_474 [Firmicutes bacterium]|nr:hypothetical protein [Bacillota bacterium]
MTLTKQDFEILNFINQYDEVDKESILEKFSTDKDATEYRLEILSCPEYRRDIIHAGRIPIKNTSYIVELYESRITETKCTQHTPIGKYKITTFGKKALQDYYLQKNTELKKHQIDIALRILPIVISALSFLLSCYAIFMASK